MSRKKRSMLCYRCICAPLHLLQIIKNACDRDVGKGVN